MDGLSLGLTLKDTILADWDPLASSSLWKLGILEHSEGVRSGWDMQWNVYVQWGWVGLLAFYLFIIQLDSYL